MTFFETIGKIIERYSSFFAQGVVNTLIIAAFSVLLGTILGTLMATMLMATMPAAKREKFGIHEISGILTPIMGRP